MHDGEERMRRKKTKKMKTFMFRLVAASLNVSRTYRVHTAIAKGCSE